MIYGLAYIDYVNWPNYIVLGLNMNDAKVKTVAKGEGHCFSKPLVEEITLLAGLGVEGDAHSGKTVKHRSRVAVDPSQPNLRQVHLIQNELFVELAAKGHQINAGDLGENITTTGIDLLSLPRHSLLHIGRTVVLEVTGLRNPCAQIDNFETGLLKAVLGRDEEGELVRKAGIMSIVLSGGLVKAGDVVKIELPAEPHLKLERV